MTVDKQKHIEAIDNSIKELLELSSHTGSPAPLAIQYIGTIIDNTTCLLTSVGNSLDGGNRYATFNEDRNWLSVMQAVHRTFFSHIHIASEIALNTIIKEKNLNVTNSRSKQVESLIMKLGDKLDNSDKKKIERFSFKYPQFDDYLRAVVENSILSDNQKRTWYGYFSALRIVRNKVSHSNILLSEVEQDLLRNNGWKTALGNNGQLVVNSRMYKQICEHLIQFFKLVVQT